MQCIASQHNVSIKRSEDKGHIRTHNNEGCVWYILNDTRGFIINNK